MRGRRLRLFLEIWSLETRKAMSYRVDFWIDAVAVFLTELALAYFVWLAIFEQTGRERLGGFTFRGMILYYLLAILFGKIVRGRERLMDLAQDIYEGSLTRYLLYPSSYFWFKYAQHLGALAPALVQLALFGLGAALFLEPPAELAISTATLGRAAVALAVGNLLYFLLLYPLQGVAFWADNVWTLNVMARFVGEFLGGLMLPLSLFPGWAHGALSLLPFQYLFYFPVMTALGEVSAGEWARGVAVALVWCAAIGGIGRAVWKRGYLVYTGVGI